MAVDIDKHIASIEEAVASSAEMMQRLYGPSWQARADLAKILITVSSGFTAALLAFSSEFLADAAASSVILALIGLVGVICTLVLCVLALLSAKELSTFQGRQFNRRPELRRRLAELDEASTEFSSQIDALWKPLLDEDLAPIGKAAERSLFCLKAGVIVFVLSLVSFLVFVGLQYCCT